MSSCYAASQNALTLMAGPAFNAAFNGSTNQRDYRWGKLHRVLLAHPLGGNFSTPPAGGAFAQPLPGLPGIPTDGGLFTVDVAGGVLRNDSSNGFMFDFGPVRRTVSSVQSIGRGIEAVSSLPGGESGELGNPFHLNLLGGWLTNDVFPLRQDILDLPGHIARWMCSFRRSDEINEQRHRVVLGRRQCGRDRIGIHAA